jgi:hypothetical protein
VFGVRLRIGRDWTFKTSEHGGGEPDNMPQAIRATDGTGRWAIYVPLTRGGKIVIPRHMDHKNDAFGGSTECRIISWKSAIAGLDSKDMIFSDAYGRLRRRHLWLLNSINIFSIK